MDSGLGSSKPAKQVVILTEQVATPELLNHLTTGQSTTTNTNVRY